MKIVWADVASASADAVVDGACGKVRAAAGVGDNGQRRGWPEFVCKVAA